MRGIENVSSEHITKCDSDDEFTILSIIGNRQYEMPRRNEVKNCDSEQLNI